jgi:hypothetical protein
MAQLPLGGLGLLIIEASRSHSDTPHSIGFLWTSDQPGAKTCYLTIHNTQKRQTSMPPAGFEPAIPASERLQTHALDRVVTGIGETLIQLLLNWLKLFGYYKVIILFDNCRLQVTVVCS